MGIFDWLLGNGEEEEGWTRDQPPPIPTKAGSRPVIEEVRHKTQAETDLRRGQNQYHPEVGRPAPEKENLTKYD